MEKIIHKLINEFIQGVDTYTHNGGTWLIFTESKRWVVELTKDKILWYNYGFFKEVFSYASMDVVENQHYITKWVEDNIINGVRYTEIGWHQYYNIDDAIERGVKKTKRAIMKTDWSVEDTLENGVKRTQDNPFSMITNVENTIQNGVKSTNMVHMKTCWSVNDTIQNGVKELYDYKGFRTSDIKDSIKNGVKNTELHKGIRPLSVDDALKNGVRITLDSDWDVPTDVIDGVLENGIKKTRTPNKDDVIENGVKETKPMDDWVNTVRILNNVIKKGVKETKHANKYDSIGPIFKEGKINDIIDNGVKVSGTFVGGNRQKENIESVIGYGTKNPTD